MGEALKDKNAVVTGAGGGIGRAVALALAEEGANVVVNDLGGDVSGKEGSSSAADEVVTEIKNKKGVAISNHESVADFDAAGRIIKSCIDNFGSIDILVNVAGNLRDKMCFNMSFDEWDSVIKVHLYGTFNCSRHACVPMKEQKSGRIISFSSDAYRGTMGHVNYGAAKGGIVSLMRSMAIELGKYEITCNVICPLAATRMTMSEDTKEGYKKKVEAGWVTKEAYERFTSMPGPEFNAPMVVYLASDYGANINGSVFSCGGGKIAVQSVAEEIHGIYKDYREQGPWTMEELKRIVPTAIGPHCPPPQTITPNWG